MIITLYYEEKYMITFIKHDIGTIQIKYPKTDEGIELYSLTRKKTVDF